MPDNVNQVCLEGDDAPATFQDLFPGLKFVRTEEAFAPESVTQLPVRSKKAFLAEVTKVAPFRYANDKPEQVYLYA